MEGQGEQGGCAEGSVLGGGNWGEAWQEEGAAGEKLEDKGGMLELEEKL